MWRIKANLYELAAVLCDLVGLRKLGQHCYDRAYHLYLKDLWP
jgi:hypothetical protein